MTDQEYNGWTNYETWATNLWIDEYQMFDAENVPESDSCLSDYVEEFVLSKLVDNFASDLIRCSLGNVNWSEILEHLREKFEIEDGDDICDQ